MPAKVLPTQSITLNTCFNGFKCIRVQPIEELNVTAYEFVHQKNGARLIHIYNDDPDNLFSIAFRTPVYDSTGVPHILEHSVLCGSKKFPIKDPFQELLKGSLQTFLNALTYPDKTVYPVSSQVEKDYYNLVDVYCDAVFNPLLTENTFYQEGWHFDVEDVSKPVGIKGIVYNEMKGVFSNFSSHVDRKSLSAIFPDTTYFHESGGEPEHITSLTYQQFREFHRKYYHPSNSFIILYGNLPSEKTLRFLNDEYLEHFERLEIDSAIQEQVLWSAPRQQSILAPAPSEDDGTATIAALWIFGEAADPVATLAGKILTHYLLGTESSPLKRALIDSGLGEDLDDISGFETDLAQTIFAAGLRKCAPENSQKVLECIQSTLKSEVEKGMDSELLEGAVRQVEFSLREVTGGHFPYNLRLAERCYRSWIYDGDPFAHIAFEKPLSEIKNKKAEYFIDLIKTRLLDNPHRLLSTIVASSEMGKQLEQQTQQHAASLTEHFTDEDRQRFAVLTGELLAQQKKPATPESLATLPKLDKHDLPAEGRTYPIEVHSVGQAQVHYHDVFTSGIVYVDCGFDLRTIPSDLIPYVPLYAELLTRCGAGGVGYERMATEIALATGGINSSISCKTKIGSQNELMLYLFFSGKSLYSRTGQMLDLMSKILNAPELDNTKQIRDILKEERNSLHASIVNSGHQFAILDASSHLSQSRYIDEVMGGITQLRFLDALVARDGVDDVIKAMKRIHALLINKNRCVISVTVESPSGIENQIKSFVNSLPSTDIPGIRHDFKAMVPEFAKAIEISSAVNFVGKVWKLPALSAEDAGRLYLAARHLSTGYLWDKVRVEGGAYGGMSMMSVSHPIFACASYRDPNLKSTVDHFTNGIKEIVSGIPQDKIDQSIIGTIGKIDSPLTPHSQGFGSTIDYLSGFTKEYKQKLRKAVLTADTGSLAATAKGILDIKDIVTTVLGGGAAIDAATCEGMSFIRESLLSQK
ncbi:MAG TPA: insulinase family protein [Chitinispirillaceae bacterium]|nr:insulinase family protein [Chitinispirillaceae bacterium]